MEDDVEQVVGERYSSHQQSRSDQIYDDRLLDDMIIYLPRSFLHQVLGLRIPCQCCQWQHLTHHIYSKDLERIDSHRQSPERLHGQARQDSEQLSSI